MNHDADLNEIETKRYDYTSVNPTTAASGDITQFSPGTLLRTEEATFLLSDTSIAQTTRDAYRARHLLALPTSTCVKNGSTVVAETQFKYDESSYPLLNDGTPINWNDPSTTVRGNVTTTRRWLNVSGATVSNHPSGSYIETHAQYDRSGSLRKVWDGNGKLAETVYADNFSDSVNRNTFAYATQVITPVPDSSGYYASNQTLTSSTKYDFNSGKVTETTDANSQSTTYSYRDDSNVLDPLHRLRKVSLTRSLGETKYEFGDTPGNLYLRTLTKQDGAMWVEDRTLLDGLGRAWRSAHYEGTNSWSIKDTEYDALGRIKRVSNPYFAANLSGAINPSGVWTTSSYDDLNRVLTVVAPDGSTVTTTYAGANVTVQDPAGKQRRSTTDGLGRLKQVAEALNGVNYLTDYSYDTLGNLVQVQQGTQTRYFFYDSLSRLVRAKNPEHDVQSALAFTSGAPTYNNWSLKYTYDSNGNLATRTDARNVTTTYGYDALNRNIWTSYSDSTPFLERHYDTLQYGKGRLSYHVNYTADPLKGKAAES